MLILSGCSTLFQQWTGINILIFVSALQPLLTVVYCVPMPNTCSCSTSTMHTSSIWWLATALHASSCHH